MTALRIGFDVSSAAKEGGRGIAAYIRGLLAALPAAAPEVEPVLFLRQHRWFRRRLLADLLPGVPRKPLLPGFRPGGVTFFHGLGVHLPRRGKLPQSFTLHDLRVLDAPQWDDPEWVRKRSRRISRTVARADAILFLAEHGLHRFLHHFPDFPAGRCGVAPLGVDHRSFHPTCDSARQRRELARLELHRPYLLQVGKLGAHKNPLASLAAWAESGAARAGLNLVYVGGADPGWREDLQREARRRGLPRRPRFLSQVERAELATLYAGARAVLFPSRYEGFGLPVLEAMACGAPGVASNAAALPEVVDHAWPTVDPEDHPGWAAALVPLLEEGAERERIRSQSLRHAAKFTWEACARRSVDFLRDTLIPPTS